MVLRGAPKAQDVTPSLSIRPPSIGRQQSCCGSQRVASIAATAHNIGAGSECPTTLPWTRFDFQFVLPQTSLVLAQNRGWRGSQWTSGNKTCMKSISLRIIYDWRNMEETALKPGDLCFIHGGKHCSFVLYGCCNPIGEGVH